MESIGFPPLTVLIFCLSVSSLFLLDIFSHKRGEPVSLKSSVLWSLLYIVASLSFGLYLLCVHGERPASLFLTGYTLEKILAFDNLFVFSLIFTYFKIPKNQQHSALHWGIIGAIVFRLIFVFIGVSSMSLIGPYVEFIFAMMILFSIYMIVKSGDDEEVDYDSVWYIKGIRKVFPGASVFMVAIFAIEISDVLFSFDSVPAIIAVTKDPLLIYSAMIFAILGLRSMYLVIAALADYLVYMDKAIIVILTFISAKLILHASTGFEVDPNTSLVIIISILSIATIASIIERKMSCLQQ